MVFFPSKGHPWAGSFGYAASISAINFCSSVGEREAPCARSWIGREVILSLLALNPIAALVPSPRHVETTIGTFGYSDERIFRKVFSFTKLPPKLGPLASQAVAEALTRVDTGTLRRQGIVELRVLFAGQPQATAKEEISSSLAIEEVRSMGAPL